MKIKVQCQGCGIIVEGKKFSRAEYYTERGTLKLEFSNFLVELISLGWRKGVPGWICVACMKHDQFLTIEQAKDLRND